MKHGKDLKDPSTCPTPWLLGLHQLEYLFIIPLNFQRSDALDSAVGVNFIDKMPQEDRRNLETRHEKDKQLGLEALTPTRMTLELANRLITHPTGIAEDIVVRVDGFTFLAYFVVVNFEPDPRVPIILGRPFLHTAKALIDLYEETLTLRVGKEELVYYVDKSEKNKYFDHAISVIDFSKNDPFSGSTTNTLPPSSSPVKTSDNLEKFADELAPLDSLPPGNDDSTIKKDFHEINFQVYSNPLFEFDDNFKSSNVNPLFEENDKDAVIKSSSSFTLTSPEESEFEAYLKKDSIPPGIDLTLPPTLEVSSSNPTSPTLTGEKVCSWRTQMFFSLVRFVWKMMTRIAIRKNIICLLTTYLHKKPKPLFHPQEVDEIKEKEDEVSSEIPIDTIVMPIRITFDTPIDFNDHFSKPKDFKKNLTVSFDSSESSILPSPLLDSDSPFNPIVVMRSYQQFLKLLVSGVVSRSTRASHPLSEISLGRSDILSSLSINVYLCIIHKRLRFSYGYIKNHKKTVKNGQARTRESEEYKKKPKNQSRSQKSQATVKEKSTHGQQKSITRRQNPK
ncbi:reverse transcriptase domain-containing protein [Tanacetum coccineum]